MLDNFNKELYDTKILRAEEDIKDLNKRVTELEKIYISIQKLTSELVELRKDTNSINERLTSIEKEPSDRYKQIAGYVITTLVGALITFALVKMGLK